ncbi:18S rRNA maturation protein [Mortierella sp. NVP85]|nr:18S rRNA maturation protein [Mortierella sp. NVP85]
MPPTHKKVVNPEKELRGKKPYNRDFKKKQYQAKPKKLDAGEVVEGSAALTKKLRDTLRMMSKSTKMPADVRLELERRVEALKLQIAEKKVDQTEQKMATKYRMLKFFESKKADRKIKVFLKQHPDWEKNADERKEMESLNLDLAYIQHFPKTEKYISLYPNENADDPVISKARSEIREKIRIALEKQEISQFVKTKREEVKAKILSHEPSTEEAIKLTTQKISNSKKRTIQDEHDPLAARARATAAREASKPVQASTTEEETFFEMIPKVVAASELNKAKEPAKKKTKKESQPEKQAPSTAQQTKKEQPKKEQPKEQPKKSEQRQATESTEGETKKLGKWAKKAIRNQQAAAAAAETQQSVSDSDSSSNSAESSSSEDEGTRQQPATKKGSVDKTKPAGKNPTAEKQDQPAGKKVEKKTDVKAGKAEVKKEKQETQTKNDQKAEVKTDAPKIATLKVNHNDTSDSDSSDESDDEPVAPVRKIVKIDETLLKELPEVPKRRGGRNQHKYRK